MNSEQRDHLISRVVDRRESAADWEALAALEHEHAGVWRELAQALRCEAELRSVLASEVAVADGISLPISGHRDVAPNRRISRWSGWLAAAACLLAWAVSSTSAPEPKEPKKIAQVELEPRHTAAAVTEPTTSIVKELPMVVLETNPARDGEGYEVVYLRRVLESRRVDQVLELAPNELGGHQPVPIDSTHLTRPEVF